MKSQGLGGPLLHKKAFSNAHPGGRVINTESVSIYGKYHELPVYCQAMVIWFAAPAAGCGLAQ
jgi:hypothetical protein